MATNNNIFIWFIRKLNEHRVTTHAAQVAFFLIISLFPFMMFLFSILQHTSIDESIILNLLEKVFPSSLGSVLDTWVEEAYDSTKAVLSITFITTLWASSKGFAGISFELDQIYEVKKRRSLLFRRLIALLYTAVFCVMIIFSLILLVFGNQILLGINHYFPWTLNLNLIVYILRSAISFLIFVSYFLLMYKFIPNRKTRFRDELPGAGFSAVSWIVFSYLYSIYIDSSQNFSSMYGSLTSVVLMMLWLYICICLVFMGAMINQYIKSHDRLRILSSLREIRGIVRSYLENKM